MQFSSLSRFLASAMVALAAVSAFDACAQPDSRFALEAGEYADLKFPATMREWSAPSKEGNDIFKPPGEGPFPAIVLAHTCGGVEPHLFEHAQRFLQEGYAVLLLDAYTVRRHYSFCTPTGVKSTRFFKDTFDALKHLHGLPGIDSRRIYLVGFSLGSFAASLASSPRVAELVDSPLRFTATVGWYGSCRFKPFRGPEWSLVREDSDRPLLLLMAGDDRETRIDGCQERLEQLKASGVPVQWHVYPGATHAFDKDNPRRGYQRHAQYTADAMSRTLSFLARWR